MAKLKHIAMSVPDPEAIADFVGQQFQIRAVSVSPNPELSQE